MTMPFFPPRQLTVGVLLLAACSDRDPPPPPPVPVIVATAERRSVPFELAATGQVEPLQTVAVQSQVEGTLRRIAFTEGDEVQRGQVLFELDPRPYRAALDQAIAALVRDSAQAANAAEEASRYQTLAEKQYVTTQQYEQIRTTAASARASLAGSRAAVEAARLNLQYATIRAPLPAGRAACCCGRATWCGPMRRSRWSRSIRSGPSWSASRFPRRISLYCRSIAGRTW